MDIDPRNPDDFSLDLTGSRLGGRGEPPGGLSIPSDRAAPGSALANDARERQSELHAAVRRNDLAAVERLIASGVDAEARSLPSKTSPLGAAASLGHLDIANALLAAGANPCALQKNGLSPLMEAARSPGAAMVESLARASPNLDAGTGSLPGAALHQAASHGQVENARILLRLGASLEATGKMLQTPLWLAAASGAPATTELLLAAGANPNHAAWLQRTPLMAAAEGRCVRCLELLATAGADFDAIDLEGLDAGAHAARAGSTETRQWFAKIQRARAESAQMREAMEEPKPSPDNGLGRRI